MEWTRNDYVLTDDPRRIDVDAAAFELAAGGRLPQCQIRVAGGPDERGDRPQAMTEGVHALWFEREIEAPRSVVCRAWTEPERLRDWYRPDDAWSTPIAEIDLRIGGAYRFGLKPPGQSPFYEVGVFREIALPDRLVYTCRFEGIHVHEPTGALMEDYETLISVEFEELAGSRSRVAVRHSGYRSTEDRDRHQNGWPRFLDQLAKLCSASK